KIFPRTIPVGRKFGVIIALEGGHEFQIATFRAEADYRDGRHPEQVVFGDARADAERRDFTINGLFFDPIKGELHDGVNGEPELTATITCEQSPDFHPEGSVFNHIRLMLEQLPAESQPELPWAAILHDIAKPVTASCDAASGSIHFYGHERIGAEMAEQILTRLRFPRKEIDDIVHAVRCHMQFKDVPQM